MVIMVGSLMVTKMATMATMVRKVRNRMAKVQATYLEGFFAIFLARDVGGDNDKDVSDRE